MALILYLMYSVDLHFNFKECGVAVSVSAIVNNFFEPATHGTISFKVIAVQLYEKFNSCWKYEHIKMIADNTMLCQV